MRADVALGTLIVTSLSLIVPLKSWALEFSDLKAGQKVFDSALGEETTVTKLNGGIFGYFQRIHLRTDSNKDIEVGSDDLKNLYKTGCNSAGLCTGRDSYLRVYGLGRAPDQGIVMHVHLGGISGDQFVGPALEDEPTFYHKKGDIVFGDAPEKQKAGDCGTEGFCIGDLVLFYKSGNQTDMSGEAGLSEITAIFPATSKDRAIRYGLEGDANFDHVARTSATFVKATPEIAACVKDPHFCGGPAVVYEDASKYVVYSDTHEFIHHLIGSGKVIATSKELPLVIDLASVNSNLIYIVDETKPGRILWTTKESDFLPTGCVANNSFCVGDYWHSRLPYDEYSGRIVGVAPAGSKIAITTQGLLPGAPYWTDVTAVVNIGPTKDSGCISTAVGPVCVNDVIQYSGKVIATSEYDFYVRDEKGNLRTLRAGEFRGKKLPTSSTVTNPN